MQAGYNWWNIPLAKCLHMSETSPASNIVLTTTHKYILHLTQFILLWDGLAHGVSEEIVEDVEVLIIEFVVEVWDSNDADLVPSLLSKSTTIIWSPSKRLYCLTII